MNIEDHLGDIICKARTAANASAEDAAAYIEWLRATGRVRSARLCAESEWERAARGAASGQNVVQGGAMIALLSKQPGRGGQRFPFGISSFCHS